MSDDANNTDKFGKQKERRLFVLAWFAFALKIFREHATASLGAIWAISVLFGLWYQVVYFWPLDVPIFHFSKLEDFLMIGSLPLILLPFALIALGLILLAISVAVMLVGLLIVAAALASIGVSFVLTLVIAAIHTGSLYVLYGFKTVLVWCRSQVPILGHLAMNRVLLFARRSRTQQISDSSKRVGEMKTAYAALRKEMRENFEKRSKILRASVHRSREECESAARGLFEKNHWRKWNGFLSENSASKGMLGVVVVIALAVTTIYGCAHSSGIKSYYSDNGIPTSTRGSNSSNSTLDVFDHVVNFIMVLRPYSEVELRLRYDDKASNVLKIGSTSDFIVFWSKGCEDNLGRYMAVPVSSISRVSPLQPGTSMAVDCKATESVQDSPSATITSRVEIQISNTLHLQHTSQDSIPRQNVIAVLTFDEDASAKEWFHNKDYRDCQSGGSAAICVASGSDGYKSPHKRDLTRILEVLAECSSEDRPAKLQVVGYYSSSDAVEFFDARDLQYATDRKSDKDFKECQGDTQGNTTADALALAFNRCVAADRARGVRNMLEHLARENTPALGYTDTFLSFEIESGTAQQLDHPREIYFGDRPEPDGIYSEIVGSLNRRVDLILSEPGKCPLGG